jgi:hypothetical protein
MDIPNCAVCGDYADPVTQLCGSEECQKAVDEAEEGAYNLNVPVDPMLNQWPEKEKECRCGGNDCFGCRPDKYL